MPSGIITVTDSIGATATATVSFTTTANVPDGSANATPGTAQYPALLSAMVKRPSWNVAGIDYRVGIRPGIVLKIPSASTLPAGAELYMGAVYIKSANVTLSGFDLSNLTVMIQDLTATGTLHIIDCATSHTGIIRTAVNLDSSFNILMEYCTLDGGGIGSSTDFASIQTWCPTVVRYCYIGRAGQGIHVSGRGCTLQYNFWEQFAWGVGQHANAIYTGGTTQPIIIQYNSVYSGASSSGPPNGPIGIGAAIALFDDGGSYTNWNISNNVVIAAFNASASYLIGPYVSSPFSATGGIVQNNYVFSRGGFGDVGTHGAYGAFYHSPGTVIVNASGNIDMFNGKTVAFDNSES